MRDRTRVAVSSLMAVALAIAARTSTASVLPSDRHHALPCRPTIACTADIVPDGAVEIELGYLSRRSGARTVTQSTPFLFKLTLAPWVQFQLGSNGIVESHGDVRALYFDTLFAGFKFHVVDQRGWRPSVSFSGAFGFPVATSQLGTVPTFDLDWTAYVTKDIGWLHADFNAGLMVWRIDGPTSFQPSIALALSGDIGDGFAAMVEGYVFGDAGAIAPADAGVLSAVAYSPWPWLTFDVGTDVALITRTRLFSVFAGLTVIPLDLWDTERERRHAAERAAMLTHPPRLN